MDVVVLIFRSIYDTDFVFGKNVLISLRNPLSIRELSNKIKILYIESKIFNDRIRFLYPRISLSKAHTHSEHAINCRVVNNMKSTNTQHIVLFECKRFEIFTNR